MQFCRLPLILCLIVLSAAAQDPFKVAPQAYQLEFENDWVKVTRVHYAPHEKIPAHDHTETGAAYVYLKDACASSRHRIRPQIVSAQIHRGAQWRHKLAALNQLKVTRPLEEAGYFPRPSFG